MADTNTGTVQTAEIVRYDDPVVITERVAVAAFIAGYTDPTRKSYATDLRIFAGWCHDHGVNVLNVKRPQLETFARWMEQDGRMPSTIGRRLSTLSSFYKYCQLEDILDKNPAVNVRRPKAHDESRTLGLDHNELGALLVQAGLGDLRDGALIALLALNGLRISEALNADVDDLLIERGHVDDQCRSRRHRPLRCQSSLTYRGTTAAVTFVSTRSGIVSTTLICQIGLGGVK